MIRCDSSNARIRRACNEVPIAVDLVLLNNPVAHRSVPQLNCSGPCVDDDGFVAVYGPPLRDVVAKEATLIAADRVRGRAFERLRSHSRHAVTAIAMETKPNVLQVIFRPQPQLYKRGWLQTAERNALNPAGVSLIAV